MSLRTHKSKFDKTAESVDKVVRRERVFWDQSWEVVHGLEAVADFSHHEEERRFWLLGAVLREGFEELFVEFPCFPWPVDLDRYWIGWVEQG
jgi:hypothetical protein